MITNPLITILILLSVEIIILCLSKDERFKKYFNFLPAVFWIYFIPMILSTLGLLDSKNAIYQKVTNTLLPASLFLLLMSVDIKAILRLGGMAIGMFFIGSLGIVAGMSVVFYFFKGIVGEEFYSGFAALSGSWTGGSANMIAVKEALGTPDKVFLPMVVVDTIVPYVWMGILVAFVSFQGVFDRWNNSDRKVLDELNQKKFKREGARPQFSLGFFLLIILLGGAVGFVSQFLARLFPVIKDVISTYAWTIIIVSLLGLLGSLTPLRKLEKYQSTGIGYFLLYFVLTTIGAKASLSAVSSSLILILGGFLVVGIHAIFLLVAARLLKAPFFLVATASQANIGGVASAPIVAEVYQTGLASVGLLLAIFGNVIGTYVGILVGQICSLLR